MKPIVKALILDGLVGAVAAAIALKGQREGTSSAQTTDKQNSGASVVAESSISNNPSANEGSGATSVSGQTESKRPKLISFGAGWCIPCRMMEPVREALKREYGHVFDLEHHDINKEEELARKYGIRVIPTLIFVSADGRILGRHEGYTPVEGVLAKWKEFGVEVTKSNAPTNTAGATNQ